MNELIDTFANRLARAISIRGIKASELSDLTGISKSKISSYMSGRFKAKQDGINILSKVLNVNPAWLIGYDVPMERIKDNNQLIEAVPIIVLGKISAGLPLYAEEHQEGYSPAPANIIKKRTRLFLSKS